MTVLTRQAIQATAHCLTGCAIGEVLGMVLATWWGLGNVASIVLAIALAFAFGYGLSLRPVLAAGVGLRAALGVVLAADTVSIATMEVVDNTFVAAVPGALAAGLSDGLFWGSLAASLVIAFALTVPVNRALIAKGKGHAVAHRYHHGHAGGVVETRSGARGEDVADGPAAERGRTDRLDGQRCGEQRFAGAQHHREDDEAVLVDQAGRDQ